MKKHLWLIGLIIFVAACASPTPIPTATPMAAITPTTPVATKRATATDTATTTPIATSTTIISNPQGLIAYVGPYEDHNLFVVNLDGTGRIKLTDYDNEPGLFLSVALSPDGRQVLFVPRHPAPLKIFAVNTDGSGIHSLTDDTPGSGFPVWSPDGHTIAYLGYNSAGMDRIYLMNRDGSNKRLLTTGSGHKEIGATWSPRGDRIAFTTSITSSPEHGSSLGDLRVVNIDGRHEMTLTAEVENISSPEWSPSGQWIAYSGWSDTRKATIFHLVSPDGSSTLEPKVDGYSDLLYPIWSPDGMQVVFAGQPVDLPNELHLILMNIPDLTWVKLTEKVDLFERCWTSDGSLIIYRVVKNRGDPIWDVQPDGSIGRNPIWAIKPDGTGSHQLPETVAGLDDCTPK